MQSSHTATTTSPTSLAITHEHAWITESTHPTSDGTVLYVRCVTCSGRRIDLRRGNDIAPAATSSVLGRTAPRDFAVDEHVG